MHTRSENCNILVCKVEQNCHLIAIYGDKTRIGLKDVRVCVIWVEVPQRTVQ
jgi:hypothetical protein